MGLLLTSINAYCQAPNKAGLIISCEVWLKHMLCVSAEPEIDPRAAQREWLRGVLRQTGLTASALAQRINKAQTTLTRFLNVRDYKHELSTPTIRAIERETGIAFSRAGRGVQLSPEGFSEGDGAPYEPPPALHAGAEADAVAQKLLELYGRASGADPWTLTSKALELAGYLPGDILIVDLNAKARGGDVVCAQSYDWGLMRARTLFRLYEPPYLLASTMEPELRKPLLVDNEKVMVRGVVVASLRPRAAAKPRAA